MNSIINKKNNLMNKYSILLFALLAVGTNSVSAQMSLGYYKFKDGAEYTGELKGRRPNGKGRTVFKNGDVYEGEYVRGNARGRVPILSATGRSMWANGIRTSSMEKELSIL